MSWRPNGGKYPKDKETGLFVDGELEPWEVELLKENQKNNSKPKNEEYSKDEIPKKNRHVK